MGVIGAILAMFGLGLLLVFIGAHFVNTDPSSAAQFIGGVFIIIGIVINIGAVIVAVKKA